MRILSPYQLFLCHVEHRLPLQPSQKPKATAETPSSVNSNMRSALYRILAILSGRFVYANHQASLPLDVCCPN